MSSFNEQMEQDRDWQSWVPGGDAEKYFTGDLVVGRLVDMAEQEGEFGITEIIVLEQEDGKRIGVWLSRTVLRNEVMNAKPQWGERIGIKYLGKQLKKNGDASKSRDHFEAYRVRVDRPLENRERINWGGSDAPPAPVEPVVVYGETTPQTASDFVPTAAPAGDDDIPF
jgi:hypothetical protein